MIGCCRHCEPATVSTSNVPWAAAAAAHTTPVLILWTSWTLTLNTAVNKTKAETFCCLKKKKETIERNVTTSTPQTSLLGATVASLVLGMCRRVESAERGTSLLLLGLWKHRWHLEWKEWTPAFQVNLPPKIKKRGERGVWGRFCESKPPHFVETNFTRRRRLDARSCWRSEEMRGVTWISEKG